MNKNNAAARAEWRSHGTVVLAAMCGMTLAAISTSSIGVVIAPIEQELGWSRTQISSGPALISLIGMTLSTFAGMAIDRVGERVIGIAAAVLLCVALALMATVTQNIVSWWLLWGLIGLASAAMPTVWMAPVTALFSSGRGLALAVTLCGTGLSSSLVPILANHFTEAYGWRTAYLGLAITFGIIAIPIALLFFRGPKELAGSSTTKQKALEPVGPTVREGFRSPAFYKLAIAAFGTSLAGTALMMNLVPIFTSTGIERSSAAAVAGIVGVTTIIGRVIGGYLMDKFSASLLGAFVTVSTIVLPIAVLSAPGSVIAAAIAVAFFGLTSGAKLGALVYLAGQHFGTRSFGTLFGAIHALLALGVGGGPMLASIVYDRSHSYSLVLWAVIPILLVVAIMFLSLGKRPTFGTSTPIAAQAAG